MDDNVIPFPSSSHANDHPTIGYCGTCRVEMPWPTQAPWPERCPNGCTPLWITSYPNEPIAYFGSGNSPA